jgi:hypothetical protein
MPAHQTGRTDAYSELICQIANMQAGIDKINNQNKLLANKSSNRIIYY